jgi:hypothetical protein
MFPTKRPNPGGGAKSPLLTSRHPNPLLPLNAENPNRLEDFVCSENHRQPVSSQQILSLLVLSIFHLNMANHQRRSTFAALLYLTKITLLLSKPDGETVAPWLLLFMRFNGLDKPPLSIIYRFE